MTLVELARVADVGEHNVANTLEELRQLYLLGTCPRRGDAGSGIGGNLAVLVRAEVQGGPREKQIRNALDAVDGKGLTTAQQVETRDLARQTRLLIDASRVSEAEELIARSPFAGVNNAHLLALGMCYVAWTPRRNMEATRTQFSERRTSVTPTGVSTWRGLESRGRWGTGGGRYPRLSEALHCIRETPCCCWPVAKHARLWRSNMCRRLRGEGGRDWYDHADEQLEAAIAEAPPPSLGRGRHLIDVWKDLDDQCS